MFFYKRGNFLNTYKILKANYGWKDGFFDYNTKTNTTAITELRLQRWGKDTHFVKCLIARGIGYRFFLVQAEQQSTPHVSLLFALNHYDTVYYSHYPIPEILQWHFTTIFDLPYSQYLVVRAGHTKDIFMPLNKRVKTHISKKDRKLVVSAQYKMEATNLSKLIWLYRTPSVYTGRGIRAKHIYHLRKVGKKDKQKGKSF